MIELLAALVAALSMLTAAQALVAMRAANDRAERLWNWLELERGQQAQLVSSMRNEALAERQDLYRRIQAPETGGYVMQEVGPQDQGEKKLHVSEDDEIREAMERTQRLLAGVDLG